MLGCWWTPGASLQTFNSNILLTGFGKAFLRGQMCETAVFGYLHEPGFSCFSPKVPKHPGRNEPHTIPVHALYFAFLPDAVCVLQLLGEPRIPHVPDGTVLLESALCGCAPSLM